MASSLAEVANRLDEELFVGREPEVWAFRSWLHGNANFFDVLNVSGPSGVGKSALLRTFQRIAVDEGRIATLADGGGFPATVRGLLSALHGSMTDDVNDVVAHLNRTCSVVLLDTFEQLGDLTGYLQAELLPRLSTRVRVVIAGRYPLGLAWSGNEAWYKLIRPLRLGPFTASESREYLRRRGMDDPHRVNEILRAAGTSPLALSLAADLSLRFGVNDFESAPEWRLIVRALLERLLGEVRDPQLRELIEACVAVRQFDEATLAAITGRTDIGVAFAQLCQLSIVRPTAHGLMLHEDLRRWLAEDLAWRNPERYNGLRARALAFYRERLRSAPRDEREWLVADRLFLWGNALIQQLFFCAEEPGQVMVQPGRPADLVEIGGLFSAGIGRSLPADVDMARLTPPNEDAEFLTAILECPATRLRVARGREGKVIGFSTVLPVCQETIPLLDAHPAYAPLVHSLWGPAQRAALPLTPGTSNIFYLLHMLYAGEMAGVIRAALLRDLASMFAKGGIHLCATFVPAYKQMLEACGFDRVPAARNQAWGPDYPVDGFVLDLSQIGVESWMDAVMNGRRLPRPPDRDDVENELQMAFRQWNDDGQVAGSRLPELLGVISDAADGVRAGAVRQRILEGLAGGRVNAPPVLDKAYRAIELTYLSPNCSHKGGARRMAVSRATLYRLLKRGVQGLANELIRSSTRDR
jgi:hypothetical protein